MTNDPCVEMGGGAEAPDPLSTASFKKGGLCTEPSPFSAASSLPSSHAHRKNTSRQQTLLPQVGRLCQRTPVPPSPATPTHPTSHPPTNCSLVLLTLIGPRVAWSLDPQCHVLPTLRRFQI